MRPYFFNNPGRVRSLKFEQDRWIGTPFYPRACAVGVGVDCVRLQAEILANTGAIPRLELPAYTLDHAKHTTRSQLLVFLLTAPELENRFTLVPLGAPRIPGDLLGLLSGMTDHHLASVDQWGNAVHAIEEHGVIRTRLDDPKFSRRICYVLRLNESPKK